MLYTSDHRQAGLLCCCASVLLCFTSCFPILQLTSSCTRRGILTHHLATHTTTAQATMHFSFLLMSVTTSLLLPITRTTSEKLSYSKDKIYKVVSILHEPHLTLRDEHLSLRGNARYKGYIPDLLVKLAHILGIKYEIRLVKDGKYGSLTRNSEWNGMIGELYRKDVDIAAAALTITAARSQVAEFTYPFQTSGIALVMNRQDVFPTTNERLNPWMFILVFKHGFWFSFFFTIASVWIIGVLIRRFHPDERLENSTLMIAARNNTFSTNSRSDAVALQVLRFSFRLFLMAIVCLYVANLVRILIEKPITEKRFTTITEILKQPDIKFGTLKYGSTMAYFKESKVKGNRKAWRAMNSPGGFLVDTHVEGYQRVKSGSAAFFAESNNINFQVQNDCDLIRVGEILNPRYFGLATQKNSTLSQALNRALLKLRETEQLDILAAKWWENAPCANVKTKVNVIVSGLVTSYIHGPVVMLFLGILIAVLLTGIALVIEKLRTKNTRRRSRNLAPLSMNDTVVIGERKSDLDTQIYL